MTQVRWNLGTVCVGQARAGLAANPARTIAAILGFLAGIAVMVVSWHAAADPTSHAGSVASGGWLAGSLLLGIMAAATAATPDPRQLRAAAVLDLLGARRWLRHAVVAVEATLLAIAALPGGWTLGLAIAAVSGTGSLTVTRIAGGLLLVGGSVVVMASVVALLAGWSRAWATVLGPRSASPSRSVPTFTGTGWLALRLVCAATLLWGSYWLSTTLDSWAGLDTFLWPTIFLAVAGLALLIPPLLRAITLLLAKLPSVTANLGAALLQNRRSLIVPPMVLAMVAAFAIAVHAMLGAGLDQREQERRRSVSARYEMTSVLEPNHVVVGRWIGTGGPSQASDREPRPLPSGFAEAVAAQVDALVALATPLAPDAIESIQAELTEATVVPIEYRAATVVGDPLVPRTSPRRVAAGTPELLAALDLEHLAPEVAAGKAVAVDPSVLDSGQVRLAPFPGSDAGTPDRLDAVPVQHSRIPIHLPAVLIPPGMGVPVEEVSGDPSATQGADEAPRGFVVRLPDPATASDADLIQSLATPEDEDQPLSEVTPVAAWFGTESLPMRFDDYGRLDASGAVGLRQPADVRLAVGLLALLSLTGLLVAMRLASVTRWPDEDVIELTGGRPSVLRRLAALQAGVVTGLATTVGLATGMVLTRLGVHHYNGLGRLGSGPQGTNLPPIPVIVPPALLWALVLIPAGAVLFACLTTARRGPESRRLTAADDVPW